MPYCTGRQKEMLCVSLETKRRRGFLDLKDIFSLFRDVFLYFTSCQPLASRLNFNVATIGKTVVQETLERYHYVYTENPLKRENNCLVCVSQSDILMARCKVLVTQRLKNAR